MCILLVSKNPNRDYKLIVIANRDEYHSRQADKLGFWTSFPGVIGGRDLEGGGGWLAASTTGRLAAVTNINGGRPLRSDVKSRGLIVKDFLNTQMRADEYARWLRSDDDRYNGFNLIIYDGEKLYWDSNTVKEGIELVNKTYTISNAPLHTKWYKTEQLKLKFQAVMENPSPGLLNRLLDILGPNSNDRFDYHSDEYRTGDRLKKDIFIQGMTYGTRCSSVVMFKNDGTIAFTEKRYNSIGATTGENTISVDTN